MRRKQGNRWLIASLALAFAGTACDNAFDPTELTGPPTVQALNQGQIKRLLRKVTGHDGSGTVVYKVIDRKGGELKAGPHKLKVPRNAVRHKTLFVMRLAGASTLEVDLRAYDLKSRSQTGNMGFRRPVLLVMSFRDADRSIDPATLTIVWVKPNGKLQPVDTEVDHGGRLARAKLRHFSGYAIAD